MRVEKWSSQNRVTEPVPPALHNHNIITSLMVHNDQMGQNIVIFIPCFVVNLTLAQLNSLLLNDYRF